MMYVILHVPNLVMHQKCAIIVASAIVAFYSSMLATWLPLTSRLLFTTNATTKSHEELVVSLVMKAE